ncbi:MAG: acyltransferase domain-containing protein, partial [Bosea sp.]|uniref:acyltransferase domain-containing protein n=1 Tax=Bosea sp. (in: a-proteobacteria) TaxID=1871050 RepID=UPI0031FEF7CE|nr:acyltransferase domain-containing protein [Bosea sp. (in: a-proteobacteria)]
AEIRLAQPALFAVEYALAKLWMAWGVQPQAMIGSSIGECTAACLAEVFSLDDALALVVERGRLMQATEPAAMLSVPLGAEERAPALGDGLSVAIDSSPSSCTVSGRSAAIAALEERLTADGLECRRLRIAIAAHSPLIEPAVAPLVERVSRMRRQPPQIPFLSNVTGTWIRDDEATDPAYWGRHLRQP